MPTRFTTSHTQAFQALGALNPGQHWSAFDVPRHLARKGGATRFVTTIWNVHSSRDESGCRVPSEIAIVRDGESGTLWYRMNRPTEGTTRKTWVAHWDGLQLALASNIPVVGVLKDVHSGRCSLEHVFDCDESREQVDGSALWLRLSPRGPVDFDVREVDIRQIILQEDAISPLVVVNQQFDAAVQQSSLRSAAQRKARLSNAPRLPKRIEVTTTVFVRNPDVVVEALLRARGICERCNDPAPFARRSDGSPYLEVHHRIPLAVGGEDTVENAIALCPNCHRAAHYA
jgi:5-methylcytosine-specific restriction endonuclease McrA